MKTRRLSHCCVDVIELALFFKLSFKFDFKILVHCRNGKTNPNTKLRRTVHGSQNLCASLSQVKKLIEEALSITLLLQFNLSLRDRRLVHVLLPGSASIYQKPRQQ